MFKCWKCLSNSVLWQFSIQIALAMCASGLRCFWNPSGPRELLFYKVVQFALAQGLQWKIAFVSCQPYETRSLREGLIIKRNTMKNVDRIKSYRPKAEWHCKFQEKLQREIDFNFVCKTVILT